MPNNCSKIRCPFNASTFKDCSMTCECEYYTKQLTKGDMIKAMFPHINDAKIEGITIHIIGYTDYEITSDWWNAPYKAEIEPQESEDKCKNCEYYRNPDYTRCHECKAESEE